MDFLSGAKEQFRGPLNELKKHIGEMLTKQIEETPFPFQKIFGIAKRLNILVWRSAAVSQAAVAGGALVAIPIPGVGAAVGLAADISVLLYTMAVTAFGVGAIIGNRNGYDWHHLDNSDYVDILAVWVGEPEFIQDASTKAILASSLAAQKTGIKIGAKATTFATSMATKKLGFSISPLLLDKVLAKIFAKLGIKAGSAIPVLGIALNAGVNGWFVNSITNAAKIYYTAKFEE
jgi:hypothetical protein